MSTEQFSDSSTGAIVLTSLLFLAAVITIVSFPEDTAAMVTIALLTVFFAALFRHYADEKDFVIGVFFLALGLRLAFGIFLQLSDLRTFFAGDANTFDAFGAALRDSWFGVSDAPPWVIARASHI